MTETRQRGTDKGDVVTEELIDGVWVVVNEAAPDDEAPEADKPRRGRPRKA
jgi:hypothetical protein